MGRMVDLAVLESATSGVATVRVDDDKLIRLCALADEFDELFTRLHKVKAGEYTLDGMLNWFLSMGAEKLQADITTLRTLLEGQA